MSSTKDANNTKNLRSRSVTFHLTNFNNMGCVSITPGSPFFDGHLAIDLLMMNYAINLSHG